MAGRQPYTQNPFSQEDVEESQRVSLLAGESFIKNMDRLRARHSQVFGSPGFSSFEQPQYQTGSLDSSSDAQVDTFLREAGPWVPPHLIDGKSPGLPSSAPNFSTPFDSFRDPAQDSGYHTQSEYQHSVRDHSIADPEPFLEEMSVNGHFEQRLQISDSFPPSRGQSGTGPAPVVTTEKRKSGPFPCPHCNVQVKAKSELKKHIQKHTKPFRCDVPDCARREGFGTTNDLDRHKKSVHKDLAAGDGISYRCTIEGCPKKDKPWPRADNFRQHLKRVHHRPIQAGEDHLKEFIVSHGVHSHGGLDPQPVETTLEGVGSAIPQFDVMSAEWPSFGPDLDLGSRNADGSDPVQLVPNDVTFTQSGGVSSLPKSPSFGLGDFSGQSQADVLQSLKPSSRQAKELRDATELLRVTSPARENDPQVPSEAPGSQSTPDVDATRCQTGSGPDAGMMTPKQSMPAPSAPRRPESPAPAESQSQDRAESRPAPEESDSDSDSDSSHSDMTEAETPQQSSGQGSSPVPQQDTPSSASSVDEPKESMDAQAMLKLLRTMDKRVVEQLLQDLGASSASPAPPKVDPTPEQLRYPCGFEKCTKSFKRHCELKKHMKRHDKPYFCTFADCEKRFGSKNDWKRHENGQHFQVEVWKCEEKASGSPDGRCRKVCNRRETFRLHLQVDHDIKDPKDVEAKLDRCRGGRNGDSSFWCGFCVAMVEAQDKDQPIGTNRFNHIELHFSGKNGFEKKEIGGWRSPGSDGCAESAASGSASGGPTRASEGSRSPASHVLAKRKSSSDEASSNRPSKKNKDEATICRAEATQWLCCNCQRGLHLIKTNDRCTDCDHDRCSSCDWMQ